MLKVDQYGYVRTAHRVYGKKIKQISKETGHSKNMIKNVLPRGFFMPKSTNYQGIPAAHEILLRYYFFERSFETDDGHLNKKMLRSTKKA